MDDAFENIIKEGGLCSEEEYPYTGKDGICKASPCGAKYNEIKSYTDVTRDDETALEFAVAEGCVLVAIEADQFAFQFSSGGVLTCSCGISLHHDVLLVGYGTDGDQELKSIKCKKTRKFDNSTLTITIPNMNKEFKKFFLKNKHTLLYFHVISKVNHKSMISKWYLNGM